MTPSRIQPTIPATALSTRLIASVQGRDLGRLTQMLATAHYPEEAADVASGARAAGMDGWSEGLERLLAMGPDTVNGNGGWKQELVLDILDGGREGAADCLGCIPAPETGGRHGQSFFASPDASLRAAVSLCKREGREIMAEALERHQPLAMRDIARVTTAGPLRARFFKTLTSGLRTGVVPSDGGVLDFVAGRMQWGHGTAASLATAMLAAWPKRFEPCTSEAWRRLLERHPGRMRDFAGDMASPHYLDRLLTEVRRVAGTGGPETGPWLDIIAGCLTRSPSLHNAKVRRNPLSGALAAKWSERHMRSGAADNTRKRRLA